MLDIVAGIADNSSSAAVMDMALHLGRVTGRDVRLVHVWTTPAAVLLGAGPLFDPMMARDDARAVARCLLDQAASSAVERAPSASSVAVTTEAREGVVGHEIVRAAEQSGALVVLGGHGHGPLGLRLGSWLPHVLRHAPVPVVVVPVGRGIASPPRRVVVGVDGSASSRAALGWAHELARLEGGELLIVHAAGRNEQPIGIDDVVRWHKNALVRVPLDSDVPTEVRLDAGNPEDVLPACVDPGDLLVVGSRGTGRVSGLVLGSVSAACVAHARVPVLVAKARDAGLARRLAVKGVALVRS